jgi:drug/metabolite transporter (DMT)-like permease
LRNHPLFKAYLALLAVCFFWGTTYIAIRMSLEAIPPVVLVSARFILSGALMLAGVLAARARLPRGRELWATALNGVLILGVGNTCLSVAELWIPSGLAALIITTSPFWMVGLDALVPGGSRLRLPTIAGILVGGVGTVILVMPQAMNVHTGGRLWWAFLVLQIANFAWCYGSLRQLRLPTQASPIVNGAVQQLAAGLACLPFAIFHTGPPMVWQPRAFAAALYLVIFGSIVGYSAYVYALDHLPVALVSLYTYVNPIVALFLGWLFYREPFGRIELAGMAVIFLGVAIVKRYTHTPTVPELD